MLPLTSGRIAVPLLFIVERELNAEDLFRLESEPMEKTAPPTLQKLKAVHHTAARLMALGKSAVEIGVACNRTPQRIRDLQNDPAFMELVTFYTTMAQDEFLDDAMRINRKLIQAGETAVDELLERVNDEDKLANIPTSELRQIASFALDRSTNPPKSAQPAVLPPQTITFNIGGAAKPQAPSAPKPEVIDLEVESES